MTHQPHTTPEPLAAMQPCGECGMPCAPGEYHPYAACLIFKGCHNSHTVRTNLQAVVEHGRLAAPPVPAPLSVTEGDVYAIGSDE